MARRSVPTDRVSACRAVSPGGTRRVGVVEVHLTADRGPVQPYLAVRDEADGPYVGADGRVVELENRFLGPFPAGRRPVPPGGPAAPR